MIMSKLLLIFYLWFIYNVGVVAMVLCKPSPVYKIREFYHDCYSRMTHQTIETSHNKNQIKNVNGGKRQNEENNCHPTRLDLIYILKDKNSYYCIAILLFMKSPIERLAIKKREALVIGEKKDLCQKDMYVHVFLANGKVV